MSGLPKKYAKMGFKKGWAAYKKAKKGGATKRKPSKGKSSTARRRKATVARKRRSTKRRGSRKKTFSVSLTRVGQLAWSYKQISGNDLGDVSQRLITAFASGNEDMVGILIDELNGTMSNVMAQPVQIAVKTSIGVMGFSLLKSVIGTKQLFKVGKFRLTT